jgi:predicted RNase H-like nuclease
MTWVAGADGIKTGWRVVLCEIETDTWSMRDVPEFGELLTLGEVPAVVCVDMPIGLHDHTPPGGRECEALARGLLGPRRSSVSPPLAGKRWHALVAQTPTRKAPLPGASA